MFGIRPWEVERLRPDELDAMRATLEAQDPEPVPLPSMADDLDAAPLFDEGTLPDPMKAPPPGLGRIA